jgi:hypothetical protein
MEDIYCFAGNALDRVSARRNDTEWITALLADPATRLLALRDLKPLVRGHEIARRWPSFKTGVHGSPGQ